MKHGSLFSGIGGFDLAAEWMGWENVFHCEISEFPKKILKYYWPNAISYENIYNTDFTIHRGTIDVLSGGFPCQPFSSAGSRKGTEDSRYLWPEMLRAIREICPKWVVGENVYGLVNWNEGMVFNKVCSDLENEGYEVIPIVLPSASINAPHKRDRIFFIAHSKNGRCGGGDSEECSSGKWEVFQGEQGWGKMGGEVEGCSRERPSSNTESEGSWEFTSEDRRGEDRRSDNDGKIWDAPDPTSIGLCINSKAERLQPETYRTSVGMGDETTPDPELLRLQHSEIARNISEGKREVEGEGSESTGATQTNGNKRNTSNAGGDVANTDSTMLEHRNGEGENGWDKQKVGVKSFGSPRGWETFPTQSPVCSRDDGFPPRLDNITFSKWRIESIKGYGNAVVPELILQIFKTIQDYANTTNTKSN